MTFFLNLLIATYISLNAICFLYLLLYGFIRAQGPWDALIYPALYGIYAHLDLKEEKQTLYTVLFTLIFGFALILYYCLLLFLAITVVVITIIHNFFNKFKYRRKYK